MLCHVALLIAIGAAATVTPVALAAQFVIADGATVGLVRADGFLHPVATWRSGDWEPASGYDAGRDLVKLAPDVRGLPRDGWRFVPAGSDAARPMAAGEATTTRSHCQQVEGFATDVGRDAPERSWPQAKIGVALRSDVPFRRAEDVERQPDAASRRAAALIVQIVHAMETHAIRGAAGARLRSLDPSVRAGAAVRFVQFRRATTSGERHYFFEARKPYRGIPDHVFVSGWLVQTDRGDTRFGQLRSWIAGRGGETSFVTSIVHGVIALPNRVFWLVEDHGYEGERYAIVDLSRERGRIVEVPGGGC